MAIKDIFLLGNPLLYEKSEPVLQEEIPALLPKIELMYDTVIDFRKKYGVGRAIAAPQIGLLKRILCLNTDKRVVMINPELSNMSPEMFEVWDDCMSFPNLLVQVMRHNQNSGYELSRNENNRAMREVARIEKAVLNY